MIYLSRLHCPFQLISAFTRHLWKKIISLTVNTYKKSWCQFVPARRLRTLWIDKINGLLTADQLYRWVQCTPSHTQLIVTLYHSFAILLLSFVTQFLSNRLFRIHWVLLINLSSCFTKHNSDLMKSRYKNCMDVLCDGWCFGMSAVT